MFKPPFVEHPKPSATLQSLMILAGVPDPQDLFFNLAWLKQMGSLWNTEAV